MDISHCHSSPSSPPPPPPPPPPYFPPLPPSAVTTTTCPSTWQRGRTMASEVVGKLCSVIVACIFALVGSLVGSVTGALIGLATESGFFRGAGIGAISGAVFSIELVESSLAMWRSDGPGIWSIMFLIDIFVSLFSGRLVREKVGPAMQSAVQSQMNAIDRPFQEALDIFETGGTGGMAQDLIDGLPKVAITPENSTDGSGSRTCCSVCLQDFQLEETVRRLPHCRHMFHLQCIDSWLLRHGSCPLCRRDF